MVIRLTAFHQALRDGQFPVRFTGRLNHNYGYPVLNFLYPFPFYFSEFFHLLGLSFINSVKAVFILSFFLSGIFMFLWTKELWGNWGGLISSLVYLYTPYRFLDVYVRGSIGEAVAFIFPPLIFLSIDRLRKKDNRFYLAIGSLSLAGLITSHNTMAMLFLALIISYILLVEKKFSILHFPFSIIFFGLSLSCFFWLPALYEKKFIIFNQVSVSNFFAHFPSLKQLLIPRWGYGPSLPLSDQDTLSFQIGVVNLAVLFLIIILLLRNLGFKKKKKTLFFVLCFLFSVFLMTKYSSWLWRLLPVYNFIQFPWRFLSLTTFTSAFLAGSLVNNWPKKFKNVVVLTFFIALIILSKSYMKPENYLFKDDSYYATNEGTTTVADEYLPIWIKNSPQKRADSKVEILEGGIEIKDLMVKSNQISFFSQGEKEALIRINTIYYPGWQLFVNSQKWDFDYQNDLGVIQFKIQKGENKVKIIFKETPLRKMADLISLGSLIFLLTFLFKKDNCQYAKIITK